MTTKLIPYNACQCSDGGSHVRGKYKMLMRIHEEGVKLSADNKPLKCNLAWLNLHP